jgi:hypothetical protein
MYKKKKSGRFKIKIKKIKISLETFVSYTAFSNYFEAMFIFLKVIFRKLFFKLYCIYLPLKKLVNRKHFSVKGKFGLVSRKVFSCKIWAENTF